MLILIFWWWVGWWSRILFIGCLSCFDTATTTIDTFLVECCSCCQHVVILNLVRYLCNLHVVVVVVGFWKDKIQQIFQFYHHWIYLLDLRAVVWSWVICRVVDLICVWIHCSFSVSYLINHLVGQDGCSLMNYWLPQSGRRNHHLMK